MGRFDLFWPRWFIISDEVNLLILRKYGSYLSRTSVNRGGTAVNNPRFVSHSDFMIACTGDRKSPEECNSASAFYNRNRNIIYLDQPTLLRSSRIHPATLLHEGLHSYSHPSFIREVITPYIDEGITEYFTREIIRDRPDLPPRTAYTEIFNILIDLIRACDISEDILCRTYFQGNINGIKRVVDRRLGDRVFDTWKVNMIINPELARQYITVMLEKIKRERIRR